MALAAVGACLVQQQVFYQHGECEHCLTRPLGNQTSGASHVPRTNPARRPTDELANGRTMIVEGGGALIQRYHQYLRSPGFGHGVSRPCYKSCPLLASGSLNRAPQPATNTTRSVYSETSHTMGTTHASSAASTSSIRDSLDYEKKEAASATKARSSKSEKLNRFLSKFQSSIVKSGAAMQAKDKEEEKRTGVKKRNQTSEEEAWDVEVVGRHQYII